MKHYLLLVLWGFALAAGFVLADELDPALREQGVLYFEGNLPGKVLATIHAGTTVYLRRDFQTALAALYNGQKIELIGMSPDGYLLKANYRNNTITGWIKPEDLPTGVDPSLFAQAQKNQARRDAVAVAIANHSVIRGMTPDEVKQSLGQPTQIASRDDAHGTSLTWIFTTYREDPQYQYVLDPYGRAILQTYYVKVPIGQMIIAFDNGVAVSIEQKKSDPNAPGVVTN